jgi:cysteine-rich repeat protein
MTLPKRTPRLAALLALLAPFSLAAACGGDDGDLITTQNGKGGTSAGASGSANAGGSTLAGASGSAGASAGSAGATSGGSAGASAGADAGAGASAAGNAGAGGDAAAGGSDAAGASGNEAAAGSGGSLPPPVCGNAAVEEGEECDDGNDLPGDGCFECKINFCGNQQLDDGEPCDGTDLAGQTCETASGNPKLVGKLGCSPSCAFDYTECFESCVSQGQEATLKKKPVDIIIVIDNSGSMSNEIKAVQDNLNKSFADIIGQSGLDYRVIVISDHGSYTKYKICVSSPLSGTTCNPIPAAPVLTEKFKQYTYNIQSKDSLTKALASYGKQDALKVTKAGWSEWLRPDAVKIFVEITDDQSSLSAASFDAQLLALPGGQFGTAQQRNYIFHSIVGVAEKKVVTDAYEPSEGTVTTKCKTAVNTGSVYQDLSKLTGGLRFPVCASTGYDAVFQRIAQGIIEGSKIECSFAVPDNPSIDQTTIQVEYTPGTGGPAQVFDLVKDVASCGPGRVYIEQNTVKLCPDACSLVQADASAKLGVLWGCGFIKD